jgi:iron complex outermembrane receptor protein
MPGLLLRGTYGRGFRAPSMAESGESATLFFRGVQDTTRCAIDEIYCGVLFVPGSLTANPQIAPEKSENWTVGLVWEPARGVSVGLDYYDIRQKNLIAFRDFQFILDNESRYGRYVTRAPAGADDIARGAPGDLILVAVPFENLSRLRTDGVDVDARWRLPASAAGRFLLALSASYLLSYKAPFAPEEPLTDFAGEYNVPRLRAVGTLDWQRGPWSGTLAGHYVDKFKQFSGAAPGADAHIKSWTTWDLQGSWSGLRDAKLTLGVKNLADKAPPIAIAETLLYVFNQHSVRGRFFYGRIDYRFR